MSQTENRKERALVEQCSQDPVFGPFYEVTSSLLQPAALSPNGLPASRAEPVLEQTSSKRHTCLDSPAGYPSSGESGPSCAPRVQVRGWSSEPTASCSHSRGLVPDPVASPVSGRSLGTGSRVSCSKRRVVLVRQSFAADSSPAELGMNFQEMTSQSFCEPPGWTDGSDRTLSPAYLSLGSDEGSATEVYYSAPEEEEEEEEGAQQPGGGLTAGTLRGGADTAEGGGSEGQLLLQGSSGFILGSTPQIEVREESGCVQEGGRSGEGGREELPVPPVLQVNEPKECDSEPPSSDPEEGNRAADLETGALWRGVQSLQGNLLDPDVRRTQEPEEQLPVQAGEEEERAFLVSAAAGRIPDAAAEGAGTMTQSRHSNAATQQQESDEPSAARPHGPPALDPGHRRLSFQPPAAEPEPDHMMSSGLSSLSTKLTLKNPSAPREEEPKPRFHKVSLVTTETTCRSSSPDPEPEYRWKNRFQGVTPFRSSRTSLPDSSSPLPEDEPDSHLSPSSSVYLSPLGAEESGRGLLEEEEGPGAGGGEERLKGETEWRMSEQELQQLPASSCSPEDEDSSFSGVFTATLVDLVSDSAPPLTPPSSPDVDSPLNDMDSLVDTLKSMGPSQRPRGPGLRAAPPVLVSSLPPIKEDAVSPHLPDPTPSPLRTEEPQNPQYTLPAELGLKRNVARDSRPPLELMKKNQEQNSSLPNGSGAPPSPTTSSRLDSSVLFGAYRSTSSDQKLENGNVHRPLFRTSSLPETGSPAVRSRDPGDTGPSGNPSGSRLERLSFLVNSSGSLNGAGDSGSSRISRGPSLNLGSPTTTSPTRLLSPTTSIDLHRPLAISEPLPFSQGPGVLQRSLSYEGPSQTPPFNGLQGGAPLGSIQGGPQFNGVHNGPRFNSLLAGPQIQQDEPDCSLMSKYRAFPDAYLTKEKEHGKLNPRPGKVRFI
ncbi:PREDICTED: uncharacterized protein LOC107094249 [Cyprinodon variegatus]|uniref:uncharacterized protein LOC107094249 n=1 Tax=Cyprinodon variegatus TaxID=28743 RepID=UPI000742A2A6|nr:PREDICTED: uncharacterized protein LOC107094249 [Cyprinodon variegatus]